VPYFQLVTVHGIALGATELPKLQRQPPLITGPSRDE
jgi:hypothetical protein